MEAFIRAYLEICPENEDAVSRDKLVNHCKQLGLDMKQVEEWLSIYDVDADGRICLEEFSRGTGLDVSELIVERNQRFLHKQNLKVADDIKIINSSMTIEKEVEITEKFKQLIADIPDTEMNLSSVITKLKSYLDTTYKNSWQVIVVYGSYCMKFSHTPFQSLQFVHRKRAVLVWRTPSI